MPQTRDLTGPEFGRYAKLRGLSNAIHDLETRPERIPESVWAEVHSKSDLTKEGSTMTSTDTQTPAPLTDDRDDQVMTLVGGKHPCSCHDSCPQLTTRYFAQGHDARLVTRLRNAVQADEMTVQEAFAEILKRGGTERLQLKLDAAVANARKPRKSRKGSSRKAKVRTMDLDGFTIRAMPETTEPATAKVGRWSYDGTIRTHRIHEEGATEADTLLVFEYRTRGANPELAETTSFKRLPTEEPKAAEQTEVPERSFAVQAEGDTSDIPF